MNACFSEHATELEIEFAVAGVAVAAADDQRAEGGFGEDADVDVVGETAGLGETVHFGEFVGADGVNFFAEERRQCEEVVQIADPEKVILIAVEFVGAVGAEAKRAAQKKLRDWANFAGAESGATLGGDEEGSGRGDWLEILQLRVHGGKTLRRAGAGVVPAERGFSGVAATGNDRVVAVVEQKMHFGVADAS